MPIRTHACGCRLEPVPMTAGKLLPLSRRRKRGGAVHGRPLHCVMFCHVRHAAAEALRFRSCISLSPSHCVPLPSIRAAAQAAGPFLRAYPACAPAPARARLAPARFAHLIARARRRTHLSRRLPPGFFRPQPLSCAEKRKGGPKEPPLCTHYTPLSPQSSPWRRISSNFHDRTAFRFRSSHGFDRGVRRLRLDDPAIMAGLV